jgi:hypothetical protein
MTIRRLSEIDLARIGPLEREEKVHRLRQLKAGRPPHTYNPFRACLGDILNLQPELFPGAAHTPWLQVSAEITKRSTSESECEFNLAVAKAMFDYSIEHRIQSYRKPTNPWAVGYGQSVTYWWNLYSVIKEQPCFIFVDPRLSNPLTRVACKFVLSIMHERLRVPDPDFSEARLTIAQFTKGSDNERAIRFVEATAFELFSFDELNEMIDETYRLWIDVLSDRAEEARRRPSGTTPLGF